MRMPPPPACSHLSPLSSPHLCSPGGWWYLLLSLMYLGLSHPAALASQTLGILPVAIPAGSQPRMVGLAADSTGVLEVSTLAMGRYQVVERQAPPGFGYRCVKDLLCLREVAKSLNVDRLLTGTLEPTREGLKLFLVLVDARSGNNLGSSELQLTAKQLGTKIPGVVFTLIEGDPAPPPVAQKAPATTPPPPPNPAPARVVTTSAPSPAEVPAHSTTSEVDVDPEDLSEFNQAKGPRRIPFVAADISGVRFVDYPLLGSGLAVGVQLHQRWAIAGSFHQQTGRDPYQDGTFFVLDGGVEVDRLLRPGVVQPWVGAQIQGIALAPTLNAACLTVGGGFYLNLTELFSIRAGLEGGVAYNSDLPQTVYSLAALQPTARLTLRLVFNLPVKAR